MKKNTQKHQINSKAILKRFKSTSCLASITPLLFQNARLWGLSPMFSVDKLIQLT